MKRSGWSGQAQQCDFGPVSTVASECFWDQPGFNYSSDLKRVRRHRVRRVSRRRLQRGKWIYTVGGVYLNKASTDNPVEWGQDNTALFLNLGIYRDVPDFSFVGALSRSRSMAVSAG